MRLSNEARLNATFAALADPTRRGILAQLAHGESSVMDLVGRSRLSQPAISKHLKVLEAAGLVERRRDSRFRRCRLRSEELANAWQWIGGYRQFWESAFDRLDAYAKELHEQDTRRPRRGRNQA